MSEQLSANVRNYAMFVLLYRTLVHKGLRVAPRFANGARHRELLRRADLRRLATILNRASQNLLGLLRREAGSATTSASFPVSQQKRTKSLSRNERTRGDVMKRIRSETFVMQRVHTEICLIDLCFMQRERRYEPRERNRIQALERAIARDRATREAEERDRAEMRARLDIWDDDESDELFYTDRVRWRSQRARRLVAEEAADNEMRAFEAREADNLRRESEAFLARQMDELQALAEEQRKAGMLLDDGAPVRLNVSLAQAAPKADAAPTKEKAPAPAVFGAEEEEEEATRKRKVPLQLLDFSASNDSEKAKERLVHIKESVPSEREMLFKAKVRWDAVTEVRKIVVT